MLNLLKLVFTDTYSSDSDGYSRLEDEAESYGTLSVSSNEFASSNSIDSFEEVDSDNSNCSGFEESSDSLSSNNHNMHQFMYSLKHSAFEEVAFDESLF